MTLSTNSVIFVIYGSLYIAFSSFSLEFLDWFLASTNFMLLDIFVFQYSFFFLYSNILTL